MTRVNNETGEEVMVRQIKEAQPNLSFGPDADLSEFGYPTLVEVDPPAPQEGHRVVRGPNEKVKARNPDGTWIADDPDTPQDEAWLWQQTWMQEPVPVVPRSTWTPLEFMERFSEEQQLAIATAAMQSAPVKLWYDKMLASQEVNIEDARTIAGMGVLLAQGLIDQETHDRVMSAEQV